MHLTQLEVENQSFEVTVNEAGLFTAIFLGEEFMAWTLRGLSSLLSQAVLSTKVEIPFIGAGSGKRGVIRGYHGGTREVLVTYEDGTKTTIRTYSRVYKPEDFSDEQRANLRTLLQEKEAIERELAIISADAFEAKDLIAEAFGEDITERKRGTQ